MSTQCLGQAWGMPPSWRRAAAWLTVVLCLLPLTMALALGVAVAIGFFTDTWARGAPRAAILRELAIVAPGFIAALACAGLGIASLWGTVAPRAFGRAPRSLHRWQLLGLRLGGVVALVMLTLLIVNDPLSDLGSTVLWLVPIAWSLIAARCLTGESGQW